MTNFLPCSQCKQKQGRKESIPDSFGSRFVCTAYGYTCPMKYYRGKSEESKNSSLRCTSCNKPCTSEVDIDLINTTGVCATCDKSRLDNN